MKIKNYVWDWAMTAAVIVASIIAGYYLPIYWSVIICTTISAIVLCLHAFSGKITKLLSFHHTDDGSTFYNEDDKFIAAMKLMEDKIYQCAVDHGWWEGPQNDAEKIALMHSELSEALEAIRMGDQPDDKIPEFSQLETELADVIIRILDYAKYKNLSIGEAVVAKHNFNITRPFKHGGKKF